jgi:hypothetical protein
MNIKVNVSIQKSSKDAKFGQCLHLRASPFVMNRIDEQSGLFGSFKVHMT